MLLESLTNMTSKTPVFESDKNQHVCEPDEALDKSSIADLGASAIDQLSDEELTRVIRASDIPRLFGHQLSQRLEVCDRPTLQRLAHLARRCCRHQGY